MKRKKSTSWDTIGRDQKRSRLELKNLVEQVVQKRSSVMKDRQRVCKLQSRAKINIANRKTARIEAISLHKKGVSVRKILNRTKIAPATFYR